MALTLRVTKGSELTYDEADGNFTYLDGKINSNISDLNIANTKIDQNSTDIATNSNTITDLDTRVTQNSTDIATNLSSLNDLDTRVTQNSTNTTSNLNSLNDLDTRVTQNSTDIAALSASSGSSNDIMITKSMVTGELLDITTTNPSISPIVSAVVKNTSNIVQTSEDLFNITNTGNNIQHVNNEYSLTTYPKVVSTKTDERTKFGINSTGTTMVRTTSNDMQQAHPSLNIKINETEVDFNYTAPTYTGDWCQIVNDNDFELFFFTETHSYYIQYDFSGNIITPLTTLGSFADGQSYRHPVAVKSVNGYILKFDQSVTDEPNTYIVIDNSFNLINKQDFDQSTSSFGVPMGISVENDNYVVYYQGTTYVSNGNGSSTTHYTNILAYIDSTTGVLTVSSTETEANKIQYISFANNGRLIVLEYTSKLHVYTVNSGVISSEDYHTDVSMYDMAGVFFKDNTYYIVYYKSGAGLYLLKIQNTNVIYDSIMNNDDFNVKYSFLIIKDNTLFFANQNSRYNVDLTVPDDILYEDKGWIYMYKDGLTTPTDYIKGFVADYDKNNTDIYCCFTTNPGSGDMNAVSDWSILKPGQGIRKIMEKDSYWTFKVNSDQNYSNYSTTGYNHIYYYYNAFYAALNYDLNKMTLEDLENLTQNELNSLQNIDDLILLVMLVPSTDKSTTPVLKSFDLVTAYEDIPVSYRGLKDTEYDYTTFGTNTIQFKSNVSGELHIHIKE